MPQVIPFAVSAIATAAGASPFLIGASALAASLVVGAYGQRQAAKKARNDYNAAQVDRLANVVATVSPRELVLGRVRKGGSVAFRGTTGQYSSSFYVHLALAAHEIDAIEEIWFNDQRVTVDVSTGQVQEAPYRRSATLSAKAAIPAGSTSVVLPFDPLPGLVAMMVAIGDDSAVSQSVAVSVAGRTVTITAGAQPYPVSVLYQYTSYTPLAWIWMDLGSHGLPDGATLASFPGVWTSAHRGIGVAKLIAAFQFDDSAFPSGPPSISVVLRGAKVYDPRTGLTVWSDNPALLARHVYQHAQFGKATVSAAEDARFIAAANACDVSHAWVVNGVLQSQKLYRAALVAPFGAAPASILDELTQAMAGMWAFAGGEMFIRAGTYSAPVATFGDADLAVIQREGESEQQDRISIVTHRERAQKFNTANVRLWDAAQGYKQVGLPPLKGTALITRDGEELSQELELSAVSFAAQALHVAGVMMRDARDPLTIEVPLKMSAYAVDLLDTVSFSFSRYGWDSVPKTFLVLGRVWDRARGVIRLTCKETNAAIFNPDAAFTAQGYGDNTALPNPWNIEPPGTLTISSGTSDLMIGADGTVVTRVRVTWPVIEDPRVFYEGKVELQWAVGGSETWNSVVVNGDVSEAVLTGLSDGVAIIVRARTRTSLASSDWGVQIMHVVIGKTEPPDAPTRVSLTQELVFFQPPPDLDLAGVRIRSVPGFVTAPIFSRGTDVIEGLVRTSPARIERRLYGVQTVVVVSEDTSGNQSAPAFASLDFGQPDVDSAIWSRAFAAESFPGTYTGCTLSGGEVVADVDPGSSVYGLDNLYGEPDVYATLYLAMTWAAALVLPPYAGALTLTSDIDGNSPRVEYRISGDAITDLYASADVYLSTDLYGTPSEWGLWPGTMEIPRATPLEFRVSVGASSEQGRISEFTLSLIMEERAQTFSNITVDAAGTRLTPSSGSPARNWVADLRAVFMTPSVDGSGAIAGRVLDFSPTLGPLVQFVDITGTAVTALGTARVEGYSDV